MIRKREIARGAEARRAFQVNACTISTTPKNCWFAGLDACRSRISACTTRSARSDGTRWRFRACRAGSPCITTCVRRRSSCSAGMRWRSTSIAATSGTPRSSPTSGRTPLMSSAGSRAPERTREQSGAHNLVTSLATAWTDRIEQRWFVGAHSNVGGGYQSNPLAQEPLKWLLEGARSAGLICDHVAEVVPSPVGSSGRATRSRSSRPRSGRRSLRAKRCVSHDRSGARSAGQSQCDREAARLHPRPHQRARGRERRALLGAALESSAEPRRVRQATRGPSPRQHHGVPCVDDDTPPVDGRRLQALHRAPALGHPRRGGLPCRRPGVHHLAHDIATGLAPRDRGGRFRA